MAGRIKISKGSIGYVEYGMARRAGLSMAWLENKAGQFIEPHGGSGLATLLNTPLPENLRVFPGPTADSYPIVTYSWLFLYRQYDDAPKLGALKQFVRWSSPLGRNSMSRWASCACHPRSSRAPWRRSTAFASMDIEGLRETCLSRGPCPPWLLDSPFVDSLAPWFSLPFGKPSYPGLLFSPVHTLQIDLEAFVLIFLPSSTF